MSLFCVFMSYLCHIFEIAGPTLGLSTKILGLSKRENIPHKSQTLPSHLEDLRIEPTGKLQHM